MLTNLNVRGSVLPRMLNFANLFTNCINLKSVTGFSDLPYVKTCGSMFNGCSSLTYTDLQFPSNAYDFASLFQNCTNLAININDYLCAYKINSSEVSNEINAKNLLKQFCTAFFAISDCFFVPIRRLYFADMSFSEEEHTHS